MQFDFKKIAHIAVEAGEIILAANRDSHSRKPDGSPQTQADLSANRFIIEELQKISDLPILSEESLVPWNMRRTWGAFWLVDPLDGTKEYLNKSTDYTVNIALVLDSETEWGTIYAPALKEHYIGGKKFGAQKNGSPIQVKQKSLADTAVVSRSHLSKSTTDFCSAHNISNTIPAGSSLKFCLVASGDADVYPRLSPTSEWDIAAGQAILEGAGGEVKSWPDLSKIGYNKAGLLNPHFVAFSNERFFQK